MVYSKYSTKRMGQMIFITRGELYFIRDILQNTLAEDDYDPDEVKQAISLVETLIYNTPEEEYGENLDLYLDEDSDYDY